MQPKLLKAPCVRNMAYLLFTDTDVAVARRRSVGRAVGRPPPLGRQRRPWTAFVDIPPPPLVRSIAPSLARHRSCLQHGCFGQFCFTITCRLKRPVLHQDALPLS